MSLSTAQVMGNQQQQQRPGGVAYGHVPQQPNLGLGPNRYVPPTFNWGRGGLDGRQPQYTQMDWNQMQGFYMPQQQNNTFTNPYMQQLQGMLGMFSNQYGGPNRQPTLPQFSSYNPGFGGPTSFYDQSLQDWGRSAMDMQRNMGQGPQGRGEYQMYGGGMGGGGGLPPGYSYDAPGDRGYTMEMPTNGGRWAYGPNGERIEVGGSSSGSGADYFRNLFGDGGGGMYGREYDRRAAYEHARQQPDFDWGNYGESMDGPRMPYGSNGGGFGGGGMQNPEGLVGNYGMSGDQIGGNSVNPIYANRGGFGGRGGYPMMPQFNPYMLARNNMMGMGFNEMFDPRFAMLFGMGGLGAMRPQGFAATQPQQPPSTANGQKPLAIGGGG